MNGFHAKTIDDQISLNRKLTFRHLKDVFRVAFIIVLNSTLKALAAIVLERRVPRHFHKERGLVVSTAPFLVLSKVDVIRVKST